MDLRPLADADQELLAALEQQEDVWEFIGALPLAPREDSHLFAVIEGRSSIGVAGLVRSTALDGKDLELVCAMRSEAQLRGFATRACKLVLAWAFETAGLDRVVACIDDGNDAARSIAQTIGMRPLGSGAPGRTVYVTYRDGRGLGAA
jgi:RimJ/RimL family protein N-acetyltransferase